MLVKNLTLRRLSVAIFLMVILVCGHSYAVQSKKKSPPQENHAIVGEVDDGLPSDENDEGMGVQESSDVPINSQRSKLKNKEKKTKAPSQLKKRDKRREKLMEGFAMAEDFHKAWYHLPIAKVKSSLEKLTGFCRVACTRSQCADEEIANNCHLICPKPTTKQCPDPLQKASIEDIGDEDVVPLGEDPPFVDSISPSITTSLNRSDKTIEDGEEGG